MADLEKAKTDPKAQFWDEVDASRAGMLGRMGDGQHFQPMAPSVDRELGEIIFFTNQATDFVASVASGDNAIAHFIVISDDHDYHACCSGRLSISTDRELIEKHWSSVVAAWFDGKGDQDLRLLRFKPADAAIWASTSSSVLFGWEILKANIGDSDPDVGQRAHISF